MKKLESNLSELGATTIPKYFRAELGAPYGGRLVWELLPDRTLVARVKYAAAKHENVRKRRGKPAGAKGESLTNSE